MVLARALYSSPVAYVDAARLDKRLNRAARLHFRLPIDTCAVLLRTELHLLPNAYLVRIRRLTFALSFFRSPFFQLHLRPLLQPAEVVGLGLYTRVRLSGVMPLFLAAFTEVGLSLDAVLEIADSPTTGEQWGRQVRDLVHAQFATDWPNIGVGGSLPDTIVAHLNLVCSRPLAGFPRYARLGGPYTLIGLRYKAERLRCSFSAGIAHHVRCNCLWCNKPDSECGIHLLTCPSPPAGVPARVSRLLERIFLEATQRPIIRAAVRQGTWTRSRARRNQALAYAYQLQWPHMTASTLRRCLHSIGLLLNQYRDAWHGAPGQRNPIWRFDLPPHRHR